MIDLNLLEHYNSFYKLNAKRTFDKSLQQFFNEKILSLLKIDTPQILELGCGTQSLFESILHPQITVTAIDFSSEAIHLASTSYDSRITYLCASISSDELFDQTLLRPESFDFIYDAHCLHCLVDPEERRVAFVNIKKLLKQTGLFASEMLITSHSTVGRSKVKYEASAYDLEQEFIQSGFKIKYFFVLPGSFIESEGRRFDVLRVILEKV